MSSIADRLPVQAATPADLTGSLSANWRPTTFLTWRVNAGMDYTGRNDIQFQSRGQGPNFSNFRLGRRTDNRFTIFHYTADASRNGSRTGWLASAR